MAFVKFLCLIILLCGLNNTTTVAKDFDPVTMDPEVKSDYPPTMVEFQIPSSGKLMNGHMYIATGAGPHPTVVFLHGFPGNEKNIDLMQSLRRAGFNTLFFHYRGSWGSEGQYSLTNILEDAENAVKQVRVWGKSGEHRVDGERVSILGHSMGGYTALMIGSKDTKLKCTVALSPANLDGLVKVTTNPDGSLINESLNAPVLALNNVSIGDVILEYQDNSERLSVMNQMPSFKERNLMIIDGSLDTVTPSESIKVLAEAVGKSQKLTYLTLEADHSYSSKRIELMRTITNWILEHCH